MQDTNNTTVVNIFGGPGVGKSIVSCELMAKLKRLGYTAEIAAEYAKDKVWENHEAIFDNQIYLFAKQFHRIFRLLGKLDFVICDSPIMLSCVYAKGHATETFFNLVVEQHRLMKTANFFIERDDSIDFEEQGRRHSLSESKKIDLEIKNMLEKYNISYESIQMSDTVADQIINRLIVKV